MRKKLKKFSIFLKNRKVITMEDVIKPKFETELKNTRNHFQTEHDTLSIKTDKRFEDVHKQLKDLDRKIQQERQDRLKQSDENLREIRKQLASKLKI